MPDTVQGWLDPLWQPPPWCHQHRASGLAKGFLPGLCVGTRGPQEPPRAVALAWCCSQPRGALWPQPSVVLVYLQPELRLEFTLSANPASSRN